MRSLDLLALSVAIPILTYLCGFITCVGESQDRDSKFRGKYCGKSYTAWTKMHEADNITLANICFKFFSFEKEGTEGAAEAQKIINTTAVYGRVDEVSFDMIRCKIRYRNIREAVVGEAAYYLSEGSDVDSAFKFYLIKATEEKMRIILGSEVQNIWNQTIDPSAKLGSKSMLDIDIYKY